MNLIGQLGLSFLAGLFIKIWFKKAKASKVSANLRQQFQTRPGGSGRRPFPVRPARGGGYRGGQTSPGFSFQPRSNYRFTTHGAHNTPRTHTRGSSYNNSQQFAGRGRGRGGEGAKRWVGSGKPKLSKPSSLGGGGGARSKYSFVSTGLGHDSGNSDVSQIGGRLQWFIGN